MDYSKAVDKLFVTQLRDWEEARRNYAALSRVAARKLTLGGTTVLLQFNPGRRRSSSATIDARSLANRKCFLCAEHQPIEQKSLPWGNRYRIQVNPYPIFSRHLTIADVRHVPQRLAGRVGDMLTLARDLPEFVIFYNGPQSGASAPDHMHFQAGVTGELPLCEEIGNTSISRLDECDDGCIGYTGDLKRGLFLIEATSIEVARHYTSRLLELLPVPKNAALPMVNVLCWWSSEKCAWRVVVFPRRKHRPSCYGEDEGRIMVSPASSEMAGLWAIPERKDFDTLTPATLQSLYDELCYNGKDFASPCPPILHT